MKIKFISMALVAVSLGGCGTDIYDKSGATQADFNQDFGYCKLYGMNAYVPPPNLPPSYVANTTYTPYGSTTTIQQQPNPAQGMANLGNAIGNALRQREVIRDCMAVKGWQRRQ